MRHVTLQTPTGLFALIEDDDRQLSTRWLTGPTDRSLDGSREDESLMPDLVDRLRRYFLGESVSFDDVPTPAGSPFHRQCWEACRSIPRGQTRSYARLAEMAGSGPRAARAAGQAMRHNPLPVIIPCHRVIGAAGDLHGFGGNSDPVGQELSTKRTLLALEGAAVNAEEPAGAGAGSAS